MLDTGAGHSSLRDTVQAQVHRAAAGMGILFPYFTMHPNTSLLSISYRVTTPRVPIGRQQICTGAGATAQGMPPIPILHHTVDQGPSSFISIWINQPYGFRKCWISCSVRTAAVMASSSKSSLGEVKSVWTRSLQNINLSKTKPL